MGKYRKIPKRKIIRFNTERVPEIVPWLDAQTNQSMSVYMLIRMAQHLYGNHNWPDLAQSLADDSISARIENKRPRDIHGKFPVNPIHEDSHSSANAHHKSHYPNKSPVKSHELNNQGHKQNKEPKSSNTNIKNSISTSDLKNLLN